MKVCLASQAIRDLCSVWPLLIFHCCPIYPGLWLWPCMSLIGPPEQRATNWVAKVKAMHFLYSLKFWRIEIWDPGVNQVDVSEACAWLVDGHLISMSSQWELCPAFLTGHQLDWTEPISITLHSLNLPFKDTLHIPDTCSLRFWSFRLQPVIFTIHHVIVFNLGSCFSLLPLSNLLLRHQWEWFLAQSLPMATPPFQNKSLSVICKTLVYIVSIPSLWFLPLWHHLLPSHGPVD